MRKLLWMVAAMLAVGVPVFAQSTSTDDHDDSAPVQSGYAIVTPVVPGNTPLTVHETYGLKRGGETIQAGLPVLPLTTSAVFFADVSGRLDRNLGISIVNPAGAATNVTLTLKQSDGTILATRNISVAPRRQNVEFITTLIPVTSSGGSFGGPAAPVTEYRGTLSISSVTPVSVLAIRFRGTTFSAETPDGVPDTIIDLPMVSQGVGGAGAFMIPQFVAGGGWATKIVVTNPSTTSVTFRLDLFKSDGTAFVAALNGQKSSSFTNVTIPAGGVFVFAPRDANGDDRF